MEEKVIDFGNGFIRLKKEEDSDRVVMIIQAPHMEKSFKLTATTIILTSEECKEISKWLSEASNVY
jgi:hypothetical protein